MSRLVDVTQTLNKKTGETEVHVESDDDGDCRRERRVLEAMQMLFGVDAEVSSEEHAGPPQVEAVRKRVKN